MNNDIEKIINDLEGIRAEMSGILLDCIKKVNERGIINFKEYYTKHGAISYAIENIDDIIQKLTEISSEISSLKNYITTHIK